MKPSFAAEVFPDDRRLTGIQTPVRALVETVRQLPFSDGSRVVQTFVGGDTIAIPHKLGRQPVGWLVIDADAYWALARTEWDVNTITLNSFSAGTITLWVF